MEVYPSPTRLRYSQQQWIGVLKLCWKCADFWPLRANQETLRRVDAWLL